MSNPSHTPLSISDKAFNRDLSVADNLIALSAAGFTHLHFSHNWTGADPLSEQALANWRSDLDAAGMQVLDVHGCHFQGKQLWSESDQDRDEALARFKHRLRVTRALNGDAMVYHVPCDNVDCTPKVLDRFIDGLRQAEPLARELNVVVALENHYQPECEHLALPLAFETFDSDYIGFTFDPGHALISGNSEWLMDTCADRLRILHLNDNNRKDDRHWCPYDPQGHADWDRVTEFIARSPYAKPVQLEVFWRPVHHGSHSDFLKQARDSALRMTRHIEKSRTTGILA